MSSPRSSSSWKRISRTDRDEKYRHIAFSSNIQDYELLSPIGGVDDMSYMYLSIHKPTRSQVALKYTDMSISPDMEFVDELTTVVANTMRYQHPSLLPYFASFMENERLWTVTLPMKGGSCRSVLDEYFPNGMSETAVVTILKYLLRALDYLHDQGVIHNDVRADNILLDFSGDVRLVGLHQVSNLAESRPSAFDYVGLPEWMAPELFEQQVSFDPRSDIYSLGITALELATGRTPYHQWPALKIMVAKLKYLPPFTEAEVNKGKRRSFSRHFFSFVSACLERDPNSRPHAHELLKHPLLKRAKGASYLVSRLVKRTNLKNKYNVAGKPSTPLPTIPSTTSSAAISSTGTSSHGHLLTISVGVPDTDADPGDTATPSTCTSVSPSAVSSSTALHVPGYGSSGNSRPGSPASLLTASTSFTNISTNNSRRASLAPSHASDISCLSAEIIEVEEIEDGNEGGGRDRDGTTE